MRRIGLGIRRIMGKLRVRAPAFYYDLVSDNWMATRQRR